MEVLKTQENIKKQKSKVKKKFGGSVGIGSNKRGSCDCMVTGEQEKGMMH